VNLYPKVMIACTTFDGTRKYFNAYVENLKKQTYKKWELVFCDNSKEEGFAEEIRAKGFKVLRSPSNPIIHIAVRDAMNNLRDYFLENQFDLMWILEQDQLPPPEALEKLVKADKQVIGLPYLLNNNNDIVCCHDFNTHQIMTYRELTLAGSAKPSSNGIIRVWGCGHGCVLVKRKIIEKFKFRVDDENGKMPRASPDTWWYEDLWKAKVPVHCLTTMMSEHLRITKGGEEIENGIVLDKPVFVRCKGDFWNSATKDRVHVMKGQIVKLPRIISPITYDAIYNQKLLVIVDAVKEKKNKEAYMEYLKKRKLKYKEDN